MYVKCWMLSKLTVTTISRHVEVKALCRAPYPDTGAYVNYLSTKLREAMVQVRYNESLTKGGHTGSGDWGWGLRRGLTGSLAVWLVNSISFNHNKNLFCLFLGPHSFRQDGKSSQPLVPSEWTAASHHEGKHLHPLCQALTLYTHGYT